MPAATPVMVLPPLSKPALVKLTGVLPVDVDVMVTPTLSTLVSPVVTLPAVPKLIFSANLMVKLLSVALPTTPILPSVKVAVLPPLTANSVPSSRFTFSVALSPLKVNGVCTASSNASIAPPTLLKVLPFTV